MKVVVTGGAGYVGSMVTARLLSAGMSVTVIDKLVYGGEALLPFLTGPDCRLIQGDVRDSSMLRDALAGASAMIHLAGVVGEQACAVDPAAAWSINVTGTEAALQAASDSGLERFILMSTCSNYGVSSPDAVVNESAPLHPLSQYAEAKVQAEKLVLESAAPACCLVLRFGTICGLSARMRFDLLVSEMARSAALGEPISIFAPAAWRPFLHVRDAARAIEHCLSTPSELLHGKVFNVVGENCQKRHLVQIVQKHYPDTPIEITEKRPDLRDYRVSAERIQRETGFTATLSVEDAFLETAAAVASGVFRDPKWPGHSAVPLHPELLRNGIPAAAIQGNRE
jgi:nucleoside-diphosphate-sugar epimerase